MSNEAKRGFIYYKAVWKVLLRKKNIQKNERQRAKEYLLHYLGELKLHFNLDDSDIIKILRNSYFELNKEPKSICCTTLAN